MDTEPVPAVVETRRTQWLAGTMYDSVAVFEVVRASVTETPTPEVASTRPLSVVGGLLASLISATVAVEVPASAGFVTCVLME